MDPQTRFFLHVLAAGGACGAVGALFGGLTGALTWHDGRAAGTVVGLTVARTFRNAAGGRLARPVFGALVGGADGLLFMTVVGVLIGASVGRDGAGPGGRGGPVLVGLALIAGGAVLFGLVGHAMVRGGYRTLLVFFAGAMTGATLGARSGTVERLFLGVVGGLLVGSAVVLAVAWLAPVNRRRGRPPGP